MTCVGSTPKSRRFTASIAIITLFTVLLSLLPCSAKAEVFEAETLFNDVIAFNVGNDSGSASEWVNGSLSACPEGNEWYAIGLAKASPDTDLSPYASALEEYLRENRIGSASTKQKYALALIACGRGDSEYLSGLVDNTAGKQGIMSYIFALNLLSNGATSERYTVENIIPVLLKLACSDGGWSLNGKTADVDVTAMAVQALSPYYDAYSEVRTAVDAGLSLLSGKQEADGGFRAFGDSNPESAAQVIIALCSLGRDPLTDPSFIKNGKNPLDAMNSYRLPDGGYSHALGGEYSLSATSQAFMALSAMLPRAAGAPFFLFREPIAELSELDSSIADTLDGEVGKEEATDDDDNANDAPSTETKKIGYKLPVCIGIAVLVAITFIVMIIKKRRAVSDYVIVSAVALGLCAAVLFTDISFPEEGGGELVEKDSPIGTVTVEILCDTQLTGRKDAVILPKTAIQIEEGETIYDVLTQLTKAHGLVLDASGGGAGGAYVRGIAGLHEFDHGDMSGWTYTVNGKRLNVACDKLTLSDGDTVVWTYSNTGWD